MLILAPMQGLTELLFRKAYHSCFAGAFDYAISPFLSLTQGVIKDATKKMEDVLPESNMCSMPVVPQILGHEKDGFVDLSNRLFDLGYSEVNWNMGCPMRRVAAKHRGSGILPYPEEVSDILEYVIPRIKCNLSVKIRLGYRSSDEIDRIIPVLNAFPLKNVTVHPRIGKQMYGGVPDLEKFKRILPLINHKVIYNGDIFTTFDYKKIRELFPSVKDVMIGRGALYNPLLPMQIREQFASDYQQSPTTIQQFISQLMNDILAMSISDESKGRKMKEYWCLLSKALPGTEQQKRAVLHATDLEDIIRLILEIAK